MKFGQRPCTIVQGLLPDFGTTLKICKKSNFDRNQLKLTTQHKDQSICIKNVIKIGGDFGAIFWTKSMGYSTGYF